MNIKEVNKIINQLQEMDVDGETMEYILKQVGMEDQMRHQLNVNSKTEEEKYFEVEESVPSIVINTYIVKAKNEVEALEKMMEGDYEEEDMKIENVEGATNVISIREVDAP